MTTESPVGYCLALIASRYSSPSPSTGKIHYHFYGQLPEIAPGCFQIATVQASPPTAPVPDNGCCVRHLRHAHCPPAVFLLPTGLIPAGGHPASPTLTHTLLLTTPTPPPPPQISPAPHSIRCRDITVDINGSGPVVTSHQPANRLLPLSPNSKDRRRPLGRCQSVRVSAPGRVMTLRRPADTIPAAAPFRASGSGAGNGR